MIHTGGRVTPGGLEPELGGASLRWGLRSAEVEVPRSVELVVEIDLEPKKDTFLECLLHLVIVIHGAFKTAQGKGESESEREKEPLRSDTEAETAGEEGSEARRGNGETGKRRRRRRGRRKISEVAGGRRSGGRGNLNAGTEGVKRNDGITLI